VARHALSAELKRSMGRGELAVFYQPIVELDTGRIAGAEALVRWRHPTRGLVSPDEFIPIAEENGLILPITRWLLQAALAQAAAWTRDGLGLEIAVNISAVHLSSGTLVDDVLGSIERNGVPARQLMLELTETAVARNLEQATAQFAALRDRGVRIAIDDFGTGYSSLSAVAALPADVLKVDRTLVAARTGVPGAVLGAITALGAALDLQVLAEGIETPEQLELARTAGCRFAQGHHLSPPVSAGQLSALLADGRRQTGRQRLPHHP
jgi:EAL domain-containing protein (putative c-di-GMP-specific phosphodiesterase class I)